jgi:drug/metabolite transporter (DMT)-like permease
MRPLDVCLLILLAALWGASYLFIRIAGPVMGAVPLMAVRLAIAAGILLGIARATGHLPDFRQRWKQFLAIGAIGNAIPFVLIGNAVIHLNASIAAILNATVPLFTAVAATAWIGAPLGVRQFFGIPLGLGGVVVLVGWSPLPITTVTLAATAQALIASAFYGLTAVYARQRFAELTPLQGAVGQVTGGAVLLLPLVFLTPLRQPLTWPAVWSLLALALLCTVIAYFIYFHLIGTAGPTRTSSVAFLIPLFSVLWGVVFLDEPLTPGIFAGLTIILLSEWLVLGSKR